MKKCLLALAASCFLFAANDLPTTIQKTRSRIPPIEQKNPKLLISGEFLYWIPDMEGLTLASTTELTEAQRVNPDTKQLETIQASKRSTIDIKGSWEPGLRLSLGYLFDTKGWDTVLNWTYFRNDTATQASSTDDQKLSPVSLPSGEFYANQVDFAKGKWQLDQNLADLEIGRNFPVGEQFLARPFFGIRGARIENRETLFYQVKVIDFMQTANISTKNIYWGAGPRVGGSANYEMGKGLGVFALGSGAILIGQIDSKPQPSRGIQLNSCFQIEVGGQWKKTFKNKYQLAIQAAWEQNFLSGISRSISRQEGDKTQFAEYSDLALKGLSASCHLNF